MEIKINGNTASIAISGSYTAEELLDVLHQIGDARAQIAKNVATEPTGQSMALALNPPYWTERSPKTGMQSLVAFLHPGFGWIGMTMTPIEAARLGQYMAHHSVIALTATATATNPTDAGSGGPNDTHSTQGGGFLH